MPTVSRAERKAAYRAMLHAALPDAGALRSRLAAALDDASLTIVEQRPNAYASSFPSAIVTCRLGDGRTTRVLVKVEHGQSHPSHGHRGDVAYESDVYRRVLVPSRVTAPRFVGAGADAATGERWLVIEYLDGAERVSDAHRPEEAMRMAARWSAAFHAAHERRAGEVMLAFLHRHDAAYYRRWAERTARLVAGDGTRWMALLPARCAAALDALVAPVTVIHGEYVPKNTLVHAGRIRPVDWESAAIAAGEVDLASITDGAWPARLVEACVDEYRRTRWPGGAPCDFELRLELARLYWNFRWLGERADWTASASGRRRIDTVRRIAERIGLL